MTLIASNFNTYQNINTPTIKQKNNSYNTNLIKTTTSADTVSFTSKLDLSNILKRTKKTNPLETFIKGLAGLHDDGKMTEVNVENLIKETLKIKNVKVQDIPANKRNSQELGYITYDSTDNSSIIHLHLTHHDKAQVAATATNLFTVIAHSCTEEYQKFISKGFSEKIALDFNEANASFNKIKQEFSKCKSFSDKEGLSNVITTIKKSFSKENLEKDKYLLEFYLHCLTQEAKRIRNECDFLSHIGNDKDTLAKISLKNQQAERYEILAEALHTNKAIFIGE